MVAVDDREEERQKQRAARRLRKQQQREAERKKQEEEAAKLAEDDEPREDPLAEYLDKVMNTMEDCKSQLAIALFNFLSTGINPYVQIFSY